jgi:hypothetical protein
MNFTDGQWIGLAIITGSLFIASSIKGLAVTLGNTFKSMDIPKFIEETRRHGLQLRTVKIKVVDENQRST